MSNADKKHRDPQPTPTFKKWWKNEGIEMKPHAFESAAEYTRRIAGIAWSNGAYCAKLENVKAPF